MIRTANRLPISDEFLSKSKNVLDEGLVSTIRTKDWSSNTYGLPLEWEKIKFFGSHGVSPAHQGNQAHCIDFYVPEGTPVYAMKEGQVKLVRDGSSKHGIETKNWWDGNFVVIEHETVEGTYECTEYEHNRNGSISVRIDDRVKKGEVIAESGNTGFTEYPHLHTAVDRYYGTGIEDYVTLKVRWDENLFARFPELQFTYKEGGVWLK